MADPREKGISQSREDNPMPEPLRVSSAKELYQSMKPRLRVGEIQISDGLNTSTALGIFEKPEIKGVLIYERPMTLLGRTFEERKAAGEIKANIAAMMIEARTAAAYDLTVQTLLSSDSFPGLSHRIIPNKIKALRAEDRLKQLESRIRSLETQFEHSLYPTQLVKAAQEELIILRSRGIELNGQLISDTLRAYLGESPFLPEDQRPPKIKKARKRFERDEPAAQTGGLASNRSSLRNADQAYHFHVQNPIYTGSVALLTLASIAIPAKACTPGQPEKPILTVTPSGIDNQPGQSQENLPSTENAGNGSEGNNDQLESTAIPTPTRPDLTDGAGGQYTQEQIDLINGSAFSQQEEMIWQWISEYWGLPEAQNRPFLPEAVDMHYIYYFDKNDPQNALVALQPGDTYGSRIFYLPIKDGQFMQAPPEAPEGEFDIPEGFGPLEISGGQWQLAVVDGQWVRIDADGTVRERINLDTAQWEILDENIFEVGIGNWAERDDGTLSPEVMYPLVGAINEQHHRFIDLIYNGMKIALAVDEDVTELNSEKLATKKNNQADGLNTEDTLKANLEAIRKTLGDAVDSYTVIVADGQITQVVFNDGNTIERFHVDSEGGLTPFSKEEEPQLLPKLEIRENKFYRADTGEEVRFGGITIDYPQGAANDAEYDTFNTLLNISKSLGSNIVRSAIAMNSVNRDIESYKKLLKIASDRGMYVMLSPYAIYQGNEYNDFYHMPLGEEHYEIVYDALRSLAELSLKYNNLILDVWNEIPEPVGTTELNRIEKSIQAISSINPNVLIGIPGGKWSRDFRYLRNNRLKDKYNNIFLHVHSNPWVAWNGKINDKGEEQYDYIEDVISWWSEFVSEYPVLIGEWQMSDQLSSTDEEKTRMEKVNDVIKKNELSFTAYRFSHWNDKQYDLLRSFSEGQADFYLRGETVNDLLQSYSQTQFDK